MLEFEVCSKTGYSARTKQNVIETDATVAIAVDFNSMGEICTQKACQKYNKPLIQLSPREALNSDKLLQFLLLNNPEKLHIAGNGIYTLQKSQELIDRFFMLLLSSLQSKKGLTSVKLIQSGGQTGVDEAAIKAAVFVGIPAKIIAPKFWTFRNISGKDIHDEHLFKQRFELNGT